LPTGTVIAFFSGLFLLMSLITTLDWFVFRSVALNENQILYLFSTSGQVIAAIYGLTLTGFIFFRNELSREESEDATLTEAIESLKQRYFRLLVFISILVILTILLGNLTIVYEDDRRTDMVSVIINVGQSAFTTSLFAVTYFIFDVIWPNRIQLASQTLQNKLDPQRGNQQMGSLEAFLRNYNRIEALLERVGERYQSRSTESYDKRYARRSSNARIAEILLRSERINKRLFERLRELITLRNAIIHGAEPVVSRELVTVSEEVLEELHNVLNVDVGEEP